MKWDRLEDYGFDVAHVTKAQKDTVRAQAKGIMENAPNRTDTQKTALKNDLQGRKLSVSNANKYPSASSPRTLMQNSHRLRTQKAASKLTDVDGRSCLCLAGGRVGMPWEQA